MRVSVRMGSPVALRVTMGTSNRSISSAMSTQEVNTRSFTTLSRSCVHVLSDLVSHGLSGPQKREVDVMRRRADPDLHGHSR